MYAITYDDVCLIPSYNEYASRRDVTLKVDSKCGKIHLDLPIMSSNMDTITEDAMANFLIEKGGIGVLHRFMSIAENLDMFQKVKGSTFVSVGCTEAEKERFNALLDAGAVYFCVDVAHAHAKYVGKMIEYMREKDKNICIMAGNVASYTGAEYLASKGADLIKVGVGAGAVCITRLQTGFGVPMLTAIQECARIDRSIVADGGIRYPGDIVKALAFGADFVMLGSMLAGSYYCPALGKQGTYRGMASKEVAEEKLGGLTDWKTSEGVSTTIPIKNLQETEDIIHNIIGGLRSGLTYSGAGNIKELQRKLRYNLVTHAGKTEAQPHIKLRG